MSLIQEKRTRSFICFMIMIGICLLTGTALFGSAYMRLIHDTETKTAANGVLMLSIIACIVMIGVLYTGTLLYLLRREEEYGKACRIVEHFAEGDFSEHLNGNQEGALYRLFSLIDEMSMSLKSKEETERQTKEFLKDTISDISHQLKTPLAALHMYNEIIEGEPENLDTVRQFAVKSETALNRMERLIELLLKVMRLDAGSIVFNHELCQVEEVIGQATEDLKMRAAAENKQLTITGSPESLISCDPLWTSEAVSNLVKNALDHTSPGDAINITWGETPAMLRIFIKDTGSGIPEEDIHHIFKRFYRGSKANDTPGIGLGLSLAKSIIEGQDGSISVQSQVGEGTTFVISMKRMMI